MDSVFSQDFSLLQEDSMELDSLMNAMFGAPIDLSSFSTFPMNPDSAISSLLHTMSPHLENTSVVASPLEVSTPADLSLAGIVIPATEGLHDKRKRPVLD